MELDVLYTHIASPPVVANFSGLAQRIANKELPHGADIIVGIHARLLKESHPLPFKPAPHNSLLNIWGRPEPIKMDVNASDVSDAEAEDNTRPSDVEKPSIRLASFPHPSGSGVSVPKAPPRPPAAAAPPISFSSTAEGRREKGKTQPKEERDGTTGNKERPTLAVSRARKSW
jgi:hypothetical protein